LLDLDLALELRLEGGEQESSCWRDVS
jgi:hypothetical protein